MRADQHAGCAEAALQRIAPPERVLQIGDDAGIRNAFDGLYVGAVALHRQHQAAAHHRVIEQHRAGAAYALFAADMRAGEPEIVAQEIDQRLAGLDPFADLLAIDAHPDLENAFAHGEAAKRELSRLNSIRIVPTPRRLDAQAVFATISRTMSMARRNSVIEASSVRKAAWAVSVTLSMRASGLPGSSGSA